MEGSGMDVAIVTTRLIGQDAISNFTMASAAALAKQGKVAVFTFAYERPPVDGVEIRFLGGENAHTMGTNLKALAHTRSLARELAKFDVVIQVNPDVGSMPACHLAKRHNPKLKVIWRFHGATPPGFLSSSRDRLLMQARNLAYAWSMRRSDRIITDSQYVKEELARKGVDPAKVVPMKLGVDLGRFGAGDGRRLREKYGVGDGFLVLYVGRLVNFKHVDELVRAMAPLDGARLVVVGSGPERESLEKLCDELRLGGRVKFAGRAPDDELPDYYAACDVWATASRHEGFCVPIIEAMAAGKPVVIPGITAMPETAGDAGLRYEAGDIGGLAGSIRRLRDDRGLYQEISKKALSRAHEFEMARVLEGYAGAFSF
jgi:glycosyltransferase involved in cell wall biosynthesis